MEFEEISFTKGEFRILQQIQQEKSVDEIAKEKGVTLSAIQNALLKIYDKTKDVISYGSSVRKFNTLRNYVMNPDFTGLTSSEIKDVDNKKNTNINLPLTEKEQIIFDLLLKGFSYDGIAKKLTISMTTVKTHINNIFLKKNYHSLPELLVKEFNKINTNNSHINNNESVLQELNRTKFLLEGKNNEYNSLKKENLNLKNRFIEFENKIKELENRPQSFNFDALRNKIKTKIEKLTLKLQFIDEIENEFN